MPTFNTSYKYYFWVAGKIACAGIVGDLFELGIEEDKLRKRRPEWAKGSVEIAEWATTPEEAQAWLEIQQEKGIPTPLAAA